MKKSSSCAAFTLVELLVVIGILGILMSILVVNMTGATESARATKCRSHMRNLAQAVQSYSISHGHYPVAGSYQYINQGVNSSGKASITYYEARGWIGWNEGSRNAYPSQNSRIQGSWNASFTDNRNDTRSGSYYAVTNGAIWSLVHDSESYVCPEHRKLCRANHVDPSWSYAMNAYFGYDWTRGQRSASTWGHRIDYGKMGQATDRTLLFAEIPAVDIGVGEVYITKSSNGDHYTDCTLQFHTDKNAKDAGGTRKCNTDNWDGTAEIIGFNHKAGNKHAANVVFADSHVEQLVLPSKPSIDNLRALTANLCNGIQVTLSNGRYLDPDGRAD